MKKRVFNQSVLAALLGAGAMAMTGCGFKMRGSFSYAFKTLLSGFGDTSTLGIEFRRVLAADGAVTLVTDPAKAQVVLDVISEQREKVVAGSTSAGQVREFQLRLRLKFKLRTPSGKDIVPDTELLVQRDISFNESAVLAKEAEEGLLYRDMQTDMVQQLLRRLAAIKEL
jgi:LPS-assembly lipoprotein